MEQTPYYKLLRYVLGRNLGFIPANTKQKYNICDATPRNQAECAERAVPGIQRVD